MYDKEIEGLLSEIERGHHTVEEAVMRFLDSLPGYRNTGHQPLTVITYKKCLLTDKNNFKDFLAAEGVHNIDQVRLDTLEFYKTYVGSRVEAQTARKYVTAVKQLFKYCYSIRWVDEDYARNMHLPKLPRKKEIQTIPPEVIMEVLQGEWGVNDFTKKRNHLIACLIIRRGMRPKELPGIRITGDIHPYKDLAYITVYGKRNVPRDVMLDEETLQALREYAIERAKYVKWRRITEEHLLLGMIPKKGSYSIATPCIQAVIRKIKFELQKSGCVWDLSSLNCQGGRRTASSKSFELAEYADIPHPELTIPGQFGHSLHVAEKHYWKKSKKNAYCFLKQAADLEKKTTLNEDVNDKMRDGKLRDILGPDPDELSFDPGI